MVAYKTIFDMQKHYKRRENLLAMALVLTSAVFLLFGIYMGRAENNIDMVIPPHMILGEKIGIECFRGVGLRELEMKDLKGCVEKQVLDFWKKEALTNTVNITGGEVAVQD